MPVADANTRPMPRYKCHKEVSALKILEVREPDPSDPRALIVPEDTLYDPFWVDVQYVEKHKPVAGGYYVRYNDGYQSFSPAEAFEEGYTRI